MNKTNGTNTVRVWPMGFTELLDVGPGWSTAVCHLSTTDLSGLPLNTGSGHIGNVREAKRRNVATRRGIKETLRRYPSDFPAFNRGVQVVCEGYAIHGDGSVDLSNPSLVDGAQTQAILKDLEANTLVFARVLTVDDPGDPKWMTLGVTFNTGTSATKLSLMGKMGYFDALEDAVGRPIQKTETDRDTAPDSVDTTALVAHTFAYLGAGQSAGMRGLRRFELVCKDFEAGKKHDMNVFLDAAPVALALWEHVLGSPVYSPLRAYRPASPLAKKTYQRTSMITMPAVFVYGGLGDRFERCLEPSHTVDRRVHKYLLARAKQDWSAMAKLGTLQAYEMEMLAAFMIAEADRAGQR